MDDTSTLPSTPTSTTTPIVLDERSEHERNFVAWFGGFDDDISSEEDYDEGYEEPMYIHY